jgi:hypothetical protein
MTSTEKPSIAVNVSVERDRSLPAYRTLAQFGDDLQFFHTKRGMRLPLGMYNMSVSRICARVSQYCQELEPLFQTSLMHSDASNATREEIASALEAMIYAAAEHGDDVEKLSSGFFGSHDIAKQNAEFRKLANKVKKLRKLTTLIANKIKHEQARLSFYSMEFVHDGTPGTLHGFYVEGVNDGVIGPHKDVHSEVPILSLTTLAWEVLDFVSSSSMALDDFLTGFVKQDLQHENKQGPHFAQAVMTAVRLPTYTFGEEHPFNRQTLRIFSDDGTKPPASSLYGTLSNPWSKSDNMRFVSYATTSIGDGSSRSFALVQPKIVSLVHWD